MFGMSGIEVQGGAADIDFVPISHASFVILAGGAAVYVDPTGDAKSYENFKSPDIILVTHEHFDHFDKNLIAALKKQNTIVIGPKIVIGQLSYGQALNNGASKEVAGIKIEAVPAYNITPDRSAEPSQRCRQWLYRYRLG